MHIGDVRLPDGTRCDLLIEDGVFEAISSSILGEPDIDAAGRLAMPGAIDVHVHFREPGHEHKETWVTGSRAAAAGGVTTVIDQPNTDPPTIDRASFEAKAALAASGSIVDYGINGGVTEGWDPEGLLAEPITALGEVFMADSTGDLGIGIELFEQAVELATAHGLLVTVHAEDASQFDVSVRDRSDARAWSAYRTAEAEVSATEQAIEIAQRYDAAMHLAHASTPTAVDRAVEAGWSCEVTPHHILLSDDDLNELGTFGRMNPPLRSEAQRKALYKRVRSGVVTMIATDHAPHTIDEKQTDIWSAPSGVPGVETMLPLLLAEVDAGHLTLEAVARLTAHAPATRFDLPRKGYIQPGYDADVVLVDLDRIQPIDAERLVTGCGWTPFDGWDGIFPELTIRRGSIVYHDPTSSLRLPTDLEIDRFGAPEGRNVRDPSP